MHAFNNTLASIEIDASDEITQYDYDYDYD